MTSTLRAAALTGVLVASALTLTACGSAASVNKSSAGSSDSVKASTATSAADFGGMDALVAAAKKEGQLNLITLPRDWANYGKLMDEFTAKYGIKISDENPEGSSQDEINAITTRKNQDRAPDAVDVGGAFAIQGQQQGLFASYKVANFAEIPSGRAATDGTWYNDYGGYISIGCNAGKVKECPKSFADLLKPEYKGMVALNGDPTQANAAFSAVYAAALANGGSLDNIQPGIDFFGKLKKSGNFNPVQSKQSTVESGETPISIDWEYLNSGYASEFKTKGINWQVNIPTDGLYAGYYNQAINKWAPHPAAARLWEEFLFSADGQNGFLGGYARPVLFDALKSAGTLDSTAAASLATVSGTAPIPSQDQITKAKAAVASGWSKALAG
ncbi:putative spermidine/putrescine transport system substrate-binding protein [Streptacidiphilus jiangxiensis]|uniref:Putative spermidine/putrescine transport system substrate-binding protein n=1 Tax=Streptacidiphilus jiangxiensis TaxID=235985 RepID=A0A1H7YRB9_STRJI|nr:ABC transporter substrate-binding protein [Streptacidiphilus jiangxiensis]SEM48620.1 putative spermidine/putrescine transport system substrate-binding protein [Streptacidiphilus jiangxiensis]